MVNIPISFPTTVWITSALKVVPKHSHSSQTIQLLLSQHKLRSQVNKLFHCQQASSNTWAELLHNSYQWILSLCSLSGRLGKLVPWNSVPRGLFLSPQANPNLPFDNSFHTSETNFRGICGGRGVSSPYERQRN